MCCDQRNQLTWGDRLVAFFVVFFVWLSPKISNICIHFISENLVIKLCKYFGFKLCFRLIFLFSAKIKTFITLAFTKKIIWRFFLCLLSVFSYSFFFFQLFLFWCKPFASVVAYNIFVCMERTLYILSDFKHKTKWKKFCCSSSSSLFLLEIYLLAVRCVR